MRNKNLNPHKENYAKYNADSVCWETFSTFADINDFSYDFIDRFSEEIYWESISKFQDLSEEFLDRYANRLNWEYISTFQILSEDCIRYHKKRVVWASISFYQNISKQFIREFQHKINWDMLYVGLNKGAVDQQFREEFKDRFNIPD